MDVVRHEQEFPYPPLVRSQPRALNSLHGSMVIQ